MDNKSHIFKHLHSTTTCPDLHNSLSFEIIDKASSKLNLKIKEALHINWRKPNLNAQQNHLALTLHPFTIACVTPFFFSVFVLLFFFVVFFSFLFLLSFSLSLRHQLSAIFYCLIYTSLLLHLITTHLASHLFLPSIISIVSAVLISIFYSLNYISLLLHLIINQEKL